MDVAFCLGEGAEELEQSLQLSKAGKDLFAGHRVP